MHAKVVTQEKYLALTNNLWGMGLAPSTSTYKTLASFLPHTTFSYIWLIVHTWMSLSPMPIHHSQAASASVLLLSIHPIHLLNQVKKREILINLGKY